MAGERHKLRSVVLKALYEVDVAGHSPDDTLERSVEGLSLSSENMKYGRELLNGIIRRRDAIDRLIGLNAPHWPVSQMSVIDRNILRLAIFEILQDNEVSVKVSINEAVELAKSYGGDNSYRFINGVLGAISDSAVRQQEGEKKSDRI